MALKLDILANTSSMVREMKQAGASVEDITDELDNLQKDGERATEKMERSFKELARESKKADTQIEKMGGSGGGFSKASEASSELKDESLANFSEMTSSFDGSMESIGETAQGILGGVAASIPGIGLAAGVAAAGIGGITARFTELGEESARIKEGIIADAIEMGDALDKEAVDARVRDILGTENTRKQAELLAEILQVNLGEAALILAGDVASAGTTVEEVMGRVNDASGNVNYDTWIDLKNTIDSTKGALEGAEQAAEAVAVAESKTAQNAKKSQAEVRAEFEKTKRSLNDLMGVPRNMNMNVKVNVDDKAMRDLEQRAARGLNVAITGTAGGRIWE